MMIVGFSRLKSWRRCHRLYNYKYRQFLKRRRPRVQLIRGTILHEMLNAFAKDNDAQAVLEKYAKQYRSLFIEEREEYGDIIGDCRKLFQNYWTTYQNDGMTVLASEQEIEVPLIEGQIVFRGHIDRVLLEKAHKRRWISDTKSHRNIPGEEARFHDLQTVLYFWAWNKVNPRRPADGIMWDYIRTKLPAEPEVLQSGFVSQRKNIDTTHQVALRFVSDHCHRTGQKISFYGPWLESLKGRESKFLKRVFLPSPPQQMIDQLVKEMVITSRQILEYPDDDTRTMTRDCSWCEMRDLCTAELRGQDAEFIRKSEFVIDEDLKDEEYVEEE